MLAGIRDILVISTPADLPGFPPPAGRRLGLRRTVLLWPNSPRPTDCTAFLIGEEFIGGDSVCLVLGDNIFHGLGLHGNAPGSRADG